MDNALVPALKLAKASALTVLILVVMDDALVHLVLQMQLITISRVLILVVMDDALVRQGRPCNSIS